MRWSEITIRKRLWLAARDCESALDVGCGPSGPDSRTKYEVDTPRYVGVDVAVAPRDLKEGRILIRGDILKHLFLLHSSSFDLVYALDVIEHLDREASDCLVAEMIRIARRRVVVFTPEGYRHSGFDDGPLCHRCGWQEEELVALGFRTEIAEVSGGTAIWAEREA